MSSKIVGNLLPEYGYSFYNFHRGFYVGSKVVGNIMLQQALR